MNWSWRGAALHLDLRCNPSAGAWEAGTTVNALQQLVRDLHLKMSGATPRYHARLPRAHTSAAPACNKGGPCAAGPLVAVQPADACGELAGAGALAGAVALLTRGGCPFLHKARGPCALDAP